MQIAIIGASGRMGVALMSEVQKAGLNLSHAIVRKNSPLIGVDICKLLQLNPTGTVFSDDIINACRNADAVIDFTNEKTTMEIFALNPKIHIIGTTNISLENINLLKSTHKNVTFYAPNMSLGANLLMKLAKQARKALGSEFDVEILEMHHRNKADAPSGTALAIGEAVKEASDTNLVDIFERKGVRPENSIGYSVVRGGDIFGEHKIMFISENEKIEISHQAFNRSIFAQGAVKAAIFAKDKQNGFYNMKDLLGDY